MTDDDLDNYDLDGLPPLVTATIRTVTPYLVGWLLTAALWIVRPLGLDLPDATSDYLAGVLPLVLGSAYYVAARRLEARWPGVPWLGSRSQPTYGQQADDGYPDLLDDPDDEDDPSYGQADGDDYGGLPVVLAEGGDGELLDTTAPDGYETAEVSAAKTLVGDILGTDFGGYDNDDVDTLVAADRIINRLVATGWRPTVADPYFVSEALLREIDRQRE